jgi:hypothetical protein
MGHNNILMTLKENTSKNYVEMSLDQRKIEICRILEILEMNTIQDEQNWMDSFSDFKCLWRNVKRQRLINKLMKLMTWYASYNDAYMAVANLARADSIKYHSPDTKDVWMRRYWLLRNHLGRPTLSAWQHFGIFLDE